MIDSEYRPVGTKNLGTGSPVKQYYVYIMASYRRTLYIGVTNDSLRRVYEHRHKLVEGFSRKYKVAKLVYYETTEDVQAAMSWEKQLKGWLRRKKVALIESMNPYWVDLAGVGMILPSLQTLRCVHGDSEKPAHGVDQA